MAIIDPPAPRQVALLKPVSKALYDYWNALRNGQRLPRRRAVDPARIPSLLPQIFLLERIDAVQTIFRLAGTALCNSFGREFRDHPFVSIWHPNHHYGITTVVRQSLLRAQPGVLRVKGLDLKRRGRQGEMILAPLLDETGRPTRLIGSLSFAESDDAAEPRPYTRIQLLTVTLIDPAQDRVVLQQAPEASARPTLTLVPSRAVETKSATVPFRNLTQPWSRLIREFMARKD